MTFPAFIPYFIAAVLLAILLIMAAIHLVHALRYGGRGPASLLTCGIFVAGIIIILITGWYYIQPNALPSTLEITLPAITGTLEIAP